jgi:hypothetical protein
MAETPEKKATPPSRPSSTSTERTTKKPANPDEWLVEETALEWGAVVIYGGRHRPSTTTPPREQPHDGVGQEGTLKTP